VDGRPTSQTGRGAVVLALDCGTNTGCAIMDADGKITLSTPMFEARGGYGLRYLKFRVWLTDTKNRLGGIDRVFYERITFAANVRSARLMWSMEAHLTCWCEHHKIPYEGFEVKTIKSAATGNGNATKESMIAAARKLGFNPNNDNEADALHVLRFGLDLMNREAA
jgi:hypothetical protein